MKKIQKPVYCCPSRAGQSSFNERQKPLILNDLKKQTFLKKLIVYKNEQMYVFQNNSDFRSFFRLTLNLQKINKQI